MKPRVYLDSTIPNRYYDEREDPKSVAWRECTREWWDAHRHRYDVVASVAVEEEVRQGVHPNKTEKLELVRSVALVPVEPKVERTVEVYIQHQLMPQDATGDALHLALASHHRCDFLLTWNCQHLANANKFSHIRHVNTMLGLFVPALLTPLELIGGDENA